MSLLERLDREVVVADGAMGTLLIARGAAPGSCLEALCLEAPDSVAQVHLDYASAGAKIVRTNSFRANAAALAAHGLHGHVNEINWQAAQIARQAVKGLGVTVAGSVGPIGPAALSCKEKDEVFRTQIGALLDGGAQMIVFETFQDVDELLLALEVKYSLHHCPALCSMAFGDDGRLPDGTSAAEAFARLRDADAEILGINGTNGPGPLEEIFRSAPGGGLPMAAFPNAGLPDVSSGQARYGLSPEAFATASLRLAALGARILGGCCGTTPAHIAAAAEVLNQPSREQGVA